MADYQAQQLQKYLQKINPTLDVTDPILRDVAINFGANIVNDVANRVAQINSKFTNTYLQSLTLEELKVYAYNTLGLIMYPGTYVTGFVHVMFTTIPDDYVAYEG